MNIPLSRAHKLVAINGVLGSNSDIARKNLFPDRETYACETFEDAFKALRDGTVELALIPVDNTIAGRVADVHHLLATSDFYITGEYFLPIDFCLMAVKGAKITDLKDVYTHVHAIPQCRKIIRELFLKSHVHPDTAGAAADVALWNDKTKCALAPALAAEIYGLDILREHVQDEANNTTRFLVLSRDYLRPKQDEKTSFITSFYFEVRNIPAALYKALGGFATNNVQVIKLESYVDPQFSVARFYAEILGHVDDRSVGLAMEELAFFAKDIRMMGTYPAHAFRNLKNN